MGNIPNRQILWEAKAMSRNDLQPYQGDQQYIFISYAHKDEVVLKIIEQMINDGYRVWFDNGIDPGTEWDDSIASHIERCSQKTI